MIKIISIALLSYSLFFKFLGANIQDIYLDGLDGKKINKIILLGLKKYSKELIYGNINSEEKTPLNVKVINSDFEHLKNLNLFQNIELKYKKVQDDSVDLIFVFSEYPIVKKISISGNAEIKESEIKKVMELKTSYIYNQTLMDKDQKNIVKLYKKNNFYNSQIHMESVKKGNGEVEVYIKINEGKALYIQKIHLIGTRFINPDEFYRIMETKESSFFLGKKTLDYKKLEKDLLKITQYMKTKGHFFGKILSTKVIQEKLNDVLGLSILIEIDEGPQFFFGDVKFKGTKIEKDEEELKKLQVFKKGELFNIQLVQFYISQIQNYYQNQSYLQVQISPQFFPQKNKDSLIDLEITINKNEKVHIEKIKIQGNSITKNYIIDQELEIFEGELFNYKKVKNSIDNLNQLQFFKSVDILFENKRYDQLSNLIFNVEEDPFGMINVGLSYNTQANFGLNFQLNKKNLFGSGWNTKANMQYNYPKTIDVGINTETRWLVPYVPVSFSIGFNYSQKEVIINRLIRKDILRKGIDYSYDYRYIGFNFDFGYPIIRNLNIFTGFNFAFTQSYNMQNFVIKHLNNSSQSSFLKDDLSDYLESKDFLSKITYILGLKFDSRRKEYGVSKGYLSSLTLFYTGGIPFYGNSHWIKVEIKNSLYFNPFWEFVLATHVRYATLFKQFTGEFVIREFDLLYFNPYKELRGWNQFVSENPFVSKGSLFSFSQEIHFPLFKPFLGLIGFFDLGDLGHKTPSFPTQIYHFSFGFGLQIVTPLFPLIIYFPIRADYNLTEKNKFYVHEGLDILLSLSYTF